MGAPRTVCARGHAWIESNLFVDSSGRPRCAECRRADRQKRKVIQPALYSLWSSMKSRCHNPRFPSYPRYGGKGVAVCDRWRESFEAFEVDVGPRPSPDHTLDRKDGTRGYEPENVRWATCTEQARNKPSLKLSEDAALCIRVLRGRGARATVIADAFDVSASLVRRIVRGKYWIPTAPTTPPESP